MSEAPIVPASKASLVILRAAALPTLLAGVIATVIGAITRGTPGAWGAIIGTLVVLLFFSVGQYALGVILDNNPQMALSAALALYLVKVGVLFGFIIAFKNTTLFDPKVFGMTVLACTLVWTIAEVWALGRTRMLVVEPGTGPGGVGSGGVGSSGVGSSGTGPGAG